jgi:hypothetical protein
MPICLADSHVSTMYNSLETLKWHFCLFSMGYFTEEIEIFFLMFLDTVIETLVKVWKYVKCCRNTHPSGSFTTTFCVLSNCLVPFMCLYLYINTEHVFYF